MDALFQNEDDFFEVVPNIIESIASHADMNKYSMEVNKIDENKLTSDIKALLKRTHLEKSVLHDHLRKCDYSEEKINFFVNCVEQHQMQLMDWSITEHNSIYGDTVINEDWQLKLILGTSDNLDAVFPVLNLEFQTVGSPGKVELKRYEFTKAGLANLIDALEAALKM